MQAIPQYYSSTGPHGEEQVVYGYQTPQGFIAMQPPQATMPPQPAQVVQQQQPPPNTTQQSVQYVYQVPGYGYVSGSGPLDPQMMMAAVGGNVQIQQQP